MPRQRSKRWCNAKKRAAKVEQGTATTNTRTESVNAQLKVEKAIPPPKSPPKKKQTQPLPTLTPPPAVTPKPEEEITVLTTATLLPPLPRKTHKVPMPGTPCSTYGCQKNEYGLCTSCGRIRPWLERPPGYYLGGKSIEEKKKVVFEGLFGEVDRLVGTMGNDMEGDEMEELRAGLEGL